MKPEVIFQELSLFSAFPQRPLRLRVIFFLFSSLATHDSPHFSSTETPPNESHDPRRGPRHAPPPAHRRSPQSPRRTLRPHPARNHSLPPACFRCHRGHRQRPPFRR